MTSFSASALLIDDARLTSVDVSGQRYAAGGRRLRPLNDFWEQLDRVMRRLPKPPSNDHSFQEFLDTRPGGRRLARERGLALQWVEGFHAADPRIASVHALSAGGWPADDVEERRLGRILDGYDRVIEWLAAPVAPRIRLGAVVTRVHWQPGTVAVHVEHPTAGHASRLTRARRSLAVPLGVLKASPGEVGAIDFVPALAQKQRPLDLLAVGSAIRYARRWWLGGVAVPARDGCCSSFRTNSSRVR